ncbi:hypothetical protein J7S78_13295 [Klebsiella oxytoca]|uniref:Uncharacterized protein n=1 Tax=Klebsiella oxytoca TaxID=571 RepID=A0AAP2BID6_KLEOX|nr:hypothetical protein [Klebsiella oxytoca]MBQ0600767.1 hypothetical protein [Klebsiella oxytoca]
MTTATTIQQPKLKLVELHDVEETLMTALSKANKAAIPNALNAHLTDVICEVTEPRIHQQAHCMRIENN